MEIEEGVLLVIDLSASWSDRKEQLRAGLGKTHLIQVQTMVVGTQKRRECLDSVGDVLHDEINYIYIHILFYSLYFD